MARTDPSYTRRAAADAVLFDEKGRVLLQAAVRREVKEETGFDVEVERLVGVYSDPAQTTVRYPSGDVVHYVSLVFECRIVGGTPRTDAESTAQAWFDPGGLPPDIMKEHVARIRDAAARRPAAFVR